MANKNSIQISFQYKGICRRETLRISPTLENLIAASEMRESIRYEIAFHTFNYARYFPNSKFAKNQTINKLFESTGLTTKSIYTKCNEGKWHKDINLILPLDGKYKFDSPTIELWVKGVVE